MNSKYIKLINRLNIQLCDVSLRDGIQSIAAEYLNTNAKKDIFHKIMKSYCPAKIEVGSLVSSKVLPVMSDSLFMYDYARSMITEQYSSHLKPRTKVLLLIPNMYYLTKAVEHGVEGMAFITSVSNAFQEKNTRKTLEETKGEIYKMCHFAKSHNPRTYVKLYVSCVNECPLRGFVQNDIVVDELMSYVGCEVDEICLSDTCGTLNLRSLKYILETSTKLGLPLSKISLHLHIFPTYIHEVVDILFYCLEKGVNKFDVSLLDGGGCSVTMGENVRPNMSYDLFYDVVDKYISQKINSETGRK